MNRLLIRHPLLSLSVWNAKLPLSPFSQTYHSYTRTRTRICKDQPALSSLPTFCTTNKDLSTHKCVPCNTKELQPMTEDAARTLLPQIAQWNLVNEGGALKLRRSWKVKTFTKGLEFFRIIADLAEAEGHHPDLHLVGWNNVIIEIWTHSVARFIHLPSQFQVADILTKAISRSQFGHFMSKLTVASFAALSLRVAIKGGLTQNDFILAAKINGLNVSPPCTISPSYTSLFVHTPTTSDWGQRGVGNSHGIFREVLIK
ncbi:hypothetical protein CR513_61436, partial [Mucuna pruriens]